VVFVAEITKSSSPVVFINGVIKPIGRQEKNQQQMGDTRLLLAMTTNVSAQIFL